MVTKQLKAVFVLGLIGLMLAGFWTSQSVKNQQSHHTQPRVTHLNRFTTAVKAPAVPLVLYLNTTDTTTMPIPTTVPLPTATPVQTETPKLVSDIAPTSKPKLKSWLNNADIKKILDRAQRNGKLFYVINRLEKMKLPKSLALIPVIESEYQDHAKSNKGAGGIWQLMPTTARQLGIKSHERFQLAQSTDAALKYFRDLYRKFGNWELAIAAYNAGDGRVERALHRNPHAKSVQELKLPNETKQYVLKFYALENYISNGSA